MSSSSLIHNGSWIHGLSSTHGLNVCSYDTCTCTSILAGSLPVKVLEARFD